MESGEKGGGLVVINRSINRKKISYELKKRGLLAREKKDSQWQDGG